MSKDYRAQHRLPDGQEQTRIACRRVVAGAMLFGLAAACSGGQPESEARAPAAEASEGAMRIRIASFNIWELSREKLDHSGSGGACSSGTCPACEAAPTAS